MEIQRLRQELGCSYFQTSVKTGENVQEIFQTMAEQIKENITSISA
jgi:GTPase SAR1 family protein